MPKRGAKSAGKPETETYEAILQRLGKAVEQLESGGLGLEQALAAYEGGVALAAQCQKLLDTAEQRIEELRDTAEQGEPP